MGAPGAGRGALLASAPACPCWGLSLPHAPGSQSRLSLARAQPTRAPGGHLGFLRRHLGCEPSGKVAPARVGPPEGGVSERLKGTKSWRQSPPDLTLFRDPVPITGLHTG